MEASGQRQAPVALSPGKEPLGYPLDRKEAGRAPAPVWTR